MLTPEYIAYATCFCLIFAGLSFKFRAVDFSGFLAGIFVGIPIIIFGGFRFFFILAFFFITASIATVFRYDEKKLKGKRVINLLRVIDTEANERCKH